MHIYEVVALKDNIAFKGIESSVVIARSSENAVRLVVQLTQMIMPKKRLLIKERLK